MKKIKFIELFAGIGGFRYGLERVRVTNKKQSQRLSLGNKKRLCTKLFNKCSKRLFTCVWANDNDPHACQIYKNNYMEGELHEGDITKIKAKTIPDHDLLTAGFPCQAFSIAGKRGGFEDTRGTLFFEIARILKVKQPRMLLLENVKGLLSHDGGKTFAKILQTLDVLGYDAEWQVLNSKNFGVPHSRERVFIIGHLRKEGRQKIFFNQRANSQNKKKIIEVNHGFHRYRTYNSKGISPSLTSYQKAGYAGTKIELMKDVKIRYLTPIECERLQGFPDEWTEGVSDSKRYECLGNAVTTNVITYIGKLIKKEEVNV
ncbi:MAG: DNA cytosine methyltransferase [Candidatus Omnitrophota bacterium]